MNNYSVYQEMWKNYMNWVKTFYGSNYKNERGAYKAAHRYAKKLQEKTGGVYYVIKDEYDE